MDVSDYVEIECSVVYNGVWIPAFSCAPHLPGPTTKRTGSNRVLYKRVIAASDIEDFTELNCFTTFVLTSDYHVKSPAIPAEPDKPEFDFVWTSPTIHVVNTSGKHAEIL